MQCSLQIIPTFLSLIQFVEEIYKAQEFMAYTSSDSSAKKTTTVLFTHIEKKKQFINLVYPYNLYYDNYPLFIWPKFCQINVKAKYMWCPSQDCIIDRCLGPHLSKGCLSKWTCKVCDKITNYILLFHNEASKAVPYLISE